MNLGPRDRRALAWLAVAALLGVIVYFWPTNDGAATVVAPAGDPVTLAETRLARLRESAATVPAKENVFKKVSADLAVREKGIIQADTAAQAQALLIQIIRRLGAASLDLCSLACGRLDGYFERGLNLWDHAAASLIAAEAGAREGR